MTWRDWICRGSSPRERDGQKVNAMSRWKTTGQGKMRVRQQKRKERQCRACDCEEITSSPIMVQKAEYMRARASVLGATKRNASTGKRTSAWAKFRLPTRSATELGASCICAPYLKCKKGNRYGGTQAEHCLACVQDWTEGHSVPIGGGKE